MPSPTYSTLLKTVSAYVDGPKAQEVIDRQLASGGVTPDTLSTADLVRLMTAVSTATKLYVADKGRREEMVARLKKMAAA